MKNDAYPKLPLGKIPHKVLFAEFLKRGDIDFSEDSSENHFAITFGDFSVAFFIPEGGLTALKKSLDKFEAKITKKPELLCSNDREVANYTLALLQATAFDLQTEKRGLAVERLITHMQLSGQQVAPPLEMEDGTEIQDGEALLEYYRKNKINGSLIQKRIDDLAEENKKSKKSIKLISETFFLVFTDLVASAIDSRNGAYEKAGKRLEALLDIIDEPIPTKAADGTPIKTGDDWVVAEERRVALEKENKMNILEKKRHAGSVMNMDPFSTEKMRGLALAPPRVG